MSRKSLYIILLSFLCNFAQSDGACVNQLIGISDTLYSLSNVQLNAENAENTCLENGGNLVSIRDQQTNGPLVELINSTYRNDVQRVWIFYKEVRDGNDQARGYRYALSPEEVDGWMSAGRLEDISYVDLYTSSRSGFEVSLAFCRFFEIRWTIRVELPHGCTNYVGEGVFKLDFQLYGSLDNMNALERFLLQRTSHPFSTKLTATDDSVPGIEGFTQRQYTIYVPDISDTVLIGAEYSENKWVWRDQSAVNFFTLPQNPSHSCAAFHFDNNAEWNLLPVDCMASNNFICEYRLIMKADYIACDGSAVNVTWNTNLLALESTFNNLRTQVDIYDGETLVVTTQAVNYSQSSMVKKWLTPRTEYVARMTISLINCGGQSITSQSVFTTSFGLPDVIESSYVDSNQSNCVIKWSFPAGYVDDILSYEFEGTSATNTSLLVVNTASLSTTDTSFSMEIPLAIHNYNKSVIFRIRAQSCQGFGGWGNVNGFCISPLENTDNGSQSGVNGSSNSSITGTIVAVILALLAVVAIIVIALFMKRRKNRNQANNVPKPHQTPGLNIDPPYVNQSNDFQPRIIGSPASNPTSSAYVNVSPVQNVPNMQNANGEQLPTGRRASDHIYHDIST